MTDTLNQWRDAMKDEQHPRHRAAWALFSPGTTAKAAARLLNDQSVDVTPWLLEILDTPELSQPSSLGKGKAPEKAIGILGEWQVTDALPHMLAIIEAHDYSEDLFDATINALQDIGPAALDAVLKLFWRVEHEKKIDLTAALSTIGKGEAKVFTAMQQVFEQEPSDDLKLFVAMSMIDLDRERTRDYLRQAERKVRFGPRMKRFIETQKLKNS